MIPDPFAPPESKPRPRQLLDQAPEGAIMRPRRYTEPRDIIGLDIGQAQDFTALALVERMWEPTGKFIDTGDQQLMQRNLQPPIMVPVIEPQMRSRINVTDLSRFPLQTDYVLMAATVKSGIEQLIAQGRPHKPILVIDHTGVGRGVFDIFRHLLRGMVPLLGVTITGGQKANQDEERPWEWTVPKKDLVGALQIVVQGDRLRVAPALKLAAVFAQEMQNFRMKVTTSANVTYEAWRDGDHDDIVLSVALACWMAGRMDRPGGLY